MTKAIFLVAWIIAAPIGVMAWLDGLATPVGLVCWAMVVLTGVVFMVLRTPEDRA